MGRLYMRKSPASPYTWSANLVLRFEPVLSEYLPLRLLCVSSSVDRGLQAVAVFLVLQPGADARCIIIGVDVLNLVDLLLGEPHVLHKRVGHGIIRRKVLVDDRGDRRRVVQLAQGVLRVLKELEVKLRVHPVRPPGSKGELLLIVVTAPYLGEHARRARLHILLIEVVRGDDRVRYLLRDLRAWLDAEDLGNAGIVEIGDAVDVGHVGRHAYAELGLALIPRTELHDIIFDLAELGLMVRQPHVLERVQVAAAHALEHRTELELREPDLPVAEFLFQKDLRHVRYHLVLVPARCDAEIELLVLRGTSAATRHHGTNHDREDYRKKSLTRLHQPSLL